MKLLENPRLPDVPQAEDVNHSGTKKLAAKKTVIAIGLGLIIVISWLGLMDNPSEAYLDGSLKQAFIAYAVARSANAVVSVLQTIHFLGLGFGEALDPVNDLVERFASVMELAIGSLFIQKMLLAITSSWLFKLALTLSGGLLIMSLYVRIGLSSLFISRAFISLVFIRFGISVVVVLNGMVAASFVNDKIDLDVAAIEKMAKSETIPELPEPPVDEASPETKPPIDTAPQDPEPVKQGWFGKVKELGLKAIGNGISIAKENYKKYNPKAMKENLEKTIPQMLNTMALFLLKSLILPLVFLYALKYALTQVWDLKPIPFYTGKPRL